ncbi:MAG: C10 family peptidase [Kiritimatiellae bacterium]|nr:C10 family peptidase [Kiritimatiellia bacterium]
MASGVKRVVALIFTCIVVDAFATVVSESDVRKAAEAFVSTDAIGSSLLSGRSVVDVSKRDMLWIVVLAPGGHVIFSGSDLVDPIVGFSKNDFAEPDPESPAFAVLEGADASVVAAEAQGDGTRHARWTKLLGGGATKSGLLRADNPSSGAVVVEPFLGEHFDQWQPYNDYAPVYEPDEAYEPYRGRCPCGCVATAAAQVFHHFKWPARIDSTITYDHTFVNGNGVDSSFPIRFNGHEPVDWDAISNTYSVYWSDPRGVQTEAVRYPIARLLLWCDVLANMFFEWDGSSANYEDIARNVSDWYTPGRWVSVGASADYSQVVADLQAGIPLQVGLDEHEVVAHGWAQDGTSKYIYLNYGWGGDNDGYYNMDNSTIDLDIQEIFVEHYPRAKPQIDPLPSVCDTNLTLRWHFPDFYTNKLSVFTVSLRKTATETTTVSENFSVPNGVVSGDDDIFKVGTHSKGYDGKLLYCVSAYSDGQYAIVNSAYYTFPEVYTLTSASELTLKLRSCYALSNVFEVQARFNGGEWTTIMSPSLSATGDSKWGTEMLNLGDHGGETIQLRFYKAYTGGSCYTEQDCIFVDDVVLTDVLPQGSAVTQDVSASARSYSFNGLEDGSTYSFTVTPVMSGALVAAEASDFAVTRTAGEMLVPVEGEVTNVSTNSVFPANDAGVQWSYVGSVTNSCNVSSVAKVTNCCVSAQLTGTLTEDSHLIFQWKGTAAISSRYNTSRYDTLKVSYINENNQSTVLHTDTNKSIMDAARTCDVDLSAYKGLKGAIKIELTTTRAKAYLRYGDLTIQHPCLTNICAQLQVYESRLVPALGMPEIRSVSSVSEGFYGECGTNTSAFTVICSSSVESLEARPSHLSLVRDEDVTVTKTGAGTFNVSITPSGVNEGNLRSRMILTLVGTDANGTKCYKDISLRFSEVAQVISDVVVSASTSGGESYSVVVPYSWIEGYGLASEGSGAAAHEAAVSATADADSDGLPNWAEYVCGTSPTDPAEKLVALITMVDGEPVVTYSPGDSQMAAGFKAVIKGTTDLAAALSTWEVVTDTRTSTCRFFRVEIVPDD